MLSTSLDQKVQETIARFVGWLDRYGETSYDYQTFYASPIAQRAKALYYKQPRLGTIAIAPIIFCEAFVPSVRRLFWKRQRFPIADAHYAMGFAAISQTLGKKSYYQRAVHFLEVLEKTRCPGQKKHYAWGFPIDSVSLWCTIKAETPLITTQSYVYEAFAQVYEIDHDQKWWRIMQSLAQHVAEDYFDTETSPRASRTSYTSFPEPSYGVVDASANRAFLLTKAARDFSNDTYRRIGERNMYFVLESQNADGSWYYAMDGKRSYVNHLDTCFVIKALAKIERLTGNCECTEAIERGVKYYVKHLFDEAGLPKPFSKAPRLTISRRELYDYAECINLAILLNGRFSELDGRLERVLDDLLTRWQRPNGSFRSRHLLLGWDNMPMHRCGQAQLFRSLCLLLKERDLNGTLLNHR